jgi:DNA replication protein DnaC
LLIDGILKACASGSLPMNKVFNFSAVAVFNGITVSLRFFANSLLRCTTPSLKSKSDTFRLLISKALKPVSAAKFGLLKTIDNFEFVAQRSVNEPLIRELLRCEFIDNNENVLLIGNSGTGKTHLATALGFAACCQGYKVRFFGCTALVTQLLEAREDRQLQRLLTQLQKQDILILDELGYVPFSKAGSELLFEVVSRAYERQSLIITTNLPFESWTEVCGSERLTGAMLDRLTHKVHIIEANGASYRLEQSRKRLARQKKRTGQN